MAMLDAPSTDLIPAQPQIPGKKFEFGPIKLGRLKKCHPRLDVRRIRSLRALYLGGGALLNDREVLEDVFPKYTYETDATYRERCKRAYYENVFALVINQISAGLAQDPVEILHDDVEELDVDEYWLDLMSDAGPSTEDGSGRKTLDQILRSICVEALVSGWAWTQAELPNPEDAPRQPTSLAEQEEDGGLRAYLIPWQTDAITDWEERRGRLLWLRTYQCETYADDPSKPRDHKTHVWTIWTPEEWVRYEWTQKPNEAPPGDEHPIEIKDRGRHSFGRVPFSRLDFCAPGDAQLWVGDLIESLCRQFFNRQNGESFQWTQYNYQQLYEFLAPEISGVDTPISEAQQDPQRAQRRRAPGQVHVRGAGDKAEFIGPNMQGADVGQQATQNMRDAILRVVQQMALAQDTSGALLRRSAESKKVDSQGTEILLGAIGTRVVTLANNLAALLAAGREDPPEDVPTFRGYSTFSIVDVDTIIQRSVEVEATSIPSATYQIEQKYQLAIAHLGPDIKEETKLQIRTELEQAITQDQFEMITPVDQQEYDDVFGGGEPADEELDFDINAENDE